MHLRPITPRPAMALLGATALVVAACTSVLPPSGTAVPGQPTQAPPTLAPLPTLDPALSDAGVVALAALPDDTRGDRTGVHVIVGQRAAGSDCAASFDGEEFSVVAWVDDAAEGQLARLSVTVPAESVPAASGSVDDIDGRVSFDFVSASGFGTLYTGDSSGDGDGRSTIDVLRAGDVLTFTFEGVTWDEVTFSGLAICAPR